MKRSAPLVCIVMVTWNHWEVSAQCLDQLMRLTYPYYQVIVVDNGSTDGTPEHIATSYPAIKLLRNAENLGFAAGCNVGLRHAQAERADYVLILNNDVSFEPDLLTRFVDGAERWPQVGIFTPAASYQDGSGRWWATAGFRHPLTTDCVKLQPKHVSTHQPVPVDYVFGTAMFLRAEVLQRVGLFDERFFMYHEDMDFCLRAQRQGFGLLLLPDVHIEHAVEASTQDQPAQRHYYKGRSSVLFFAKHTRGWRVPLVFGYRLFSALKWTVTWVAARRFELIRGYWKGLWDGWRQADLI